MFSPLVFDFFYIFGILWFEKNNQCSAIWTIFLTSFIISSHNFIAYSFKRHIWKSCKILFLFHNFIKKKDAKIYCNKSIDIMIIRHSIFLLFTWKQNNFHWCKDYSTMCYYKGLLLHTFQNIKHMLKTMLVFVLVLLISSV